MDPSFCEKNGFQKNPCESPTCNLGSTSGFRGKLANLKGGGSGKQAKHWWRIGDIYIYILRTFQQTPGAYPKPPTNSLWRNSFHLGVWGCLGYAPGVCWVSLRYIYIYYIPGSSKCVKFVPKITRKSPTKRQKFYICGRSRYISIHI